jgi:hypothetical protein
MTRKQSPEKVGAKRYFACGGAWFVGPLAFDVCDSFAAHPARRTRQVQPAKQVKTTKNLSFIGLDHKRQRKEMATQIRKLDESDWFWLCANRASA